MSNNDFRNNGGHKCVKTQDGEQMAQRIGAVAYVENSALTKEGVRNVSTKLLILTLNLKKSFPSSPNGLK